MRHSKNYEKVKRYYNMGMWDETRVRNAVDMGWITEDEFEEITGKPFNEEAPTETTPEEQTPEEPVETATEESTETTTEEPQ